MRERSLTDIADAHGSDKGTLGPSRVFGGHNYTDIYEAYLSRKRGEAVRILEIGIGVSGPASREYIDHGRNKGGGASLKMWYEYFPHARVYAIDVNPASQFDNDRITTFVADQSDPAEIAGFLARYGNEPLDFIVDDGSHRPDHQQASLGLLFPALRSGGLYFIEDLEDNGSGDSALGRHACDKVLNTRHVLKGFLEDGVFPSPNSLKDPDYLAANVASIAFHVLQARIDPLSLFKRARNAKLRFRRGSEKLAVIVKR